MHKFLAFLLTITGGILIMSSVAFAQDTPNPAPKSGETTKTTIEKNVLPLSEDGYDRIFTKNRAAELVDYKNDDTGSAVRSLFVKADGSPSTIVIIFNIIAGAVALMFIAINAANFIVARGEEEQLNKVKTNLGYIIVGLFTIAAANLLAFSIFNVETRDFLTGNEVSDEFYDLVIQAKTFVQYIVFAVAVIALMISGYELLTRMGSEESFTKEKQFIRHFLLAAGIIAFAEVLVRGIFYARKVGGEFDSGTAVSVGITEIVGLTNFMLGLVAASATFMLVLASFYYMLSFGDEDRANRAKKIMISCVMGIIIAISAYTIIAYFTRL